MGLKIGKFFKRTIAPVIRKVAPAFGPKGMALAAATNVATSLERPRAMAASFAPTPSLPSVIAGGARAIRTMAGVPAIATTVTRVTYKMVSKARNMIRILGIAGAASALGVGVDELADYATRPVRRPAKGISGRDLRVTRRTVSALNKHVAMMSQLCPPRRGGRTIKRRK